MNPDALMPSVQGGVSSWPHGSGGMGGRKDDFVNEPPGISWAILRMP